MPPGTRSNPDKSEDFNSNIINFLKSEEFGDIISKIVISETKQLQLQILDLKNEIVALKQSNIEMVSLLSNKNLNNNKSFNKEYNYPKTSQSAISYAEIASTRSGEQKTKQTDVCDKNVQQSIDFIAVTKMGPVNTRTNINDFQTLDKNTGLSKSNDWREVKRKRNSTNKSIMGNGDTTDIKAIPKTSSLFVSRIEPSTDKDLLKFFDDLMNEDWNKALSSEDQPATNRSRPYVAATTQGLFWYAGDVVPNQQGLFVTEQKGLVLSHKTSPGSSRVKMSTFSPFPRRDSKRSEENCVHLN
ncbi:hypothetical protein QE152_g993 [Popillia japonica]|uniref:Uncharacterized protein n=1 Tax=Popillia japonica TaxID=7064 RepID=A0AAW1N9S1_POPJA